MKKIYLIRHADSVQNAGEVTSSPEKISLSLVGHRQATELVTKLTDTPDLIVVSEYLRTQQTAEPVIQKFSATPVETWNIHEFTYLNSDRCTNMNAQMRKPLIEEYWKRNNPWHKDGGNAESFDQFLHRINSFFVKIRSRKEDVTYIFTHGQFILGSKMILENEGMPSYATLKTWMSEFHQRSLKEIVLNASVLEINM